MPLRPVLYEFLKLEVTIETSSMKTRQEAVQNQTLLYQRTRAFNPMLRHLAYVSARRPFLLSHNSPQPRLSLADGLSLIALPWASYSRHVGHPCAHLLTPCSPPRLNDLAPHWRLLPSAALASSTRTKTKTRVCRMQRQVVRNAPRRFDPTNLVPRMASRILAQAPGLLW